MWNPALVPWTLCTVSSCVREFWLQPYLLLSTLSRSTSWPPSARGEERERERDVQAIQRLSLHPDVSWQRPFGSSVIYLCSSSLKVWPPPKTGQLTHIQQIDAQRTFITFFFPNNTEVTGMKANGVNLKCIVVGVRFLCMNALHSWEFLLEKNNIFEKRNIISIYISIFFYH